MLFMESVKLKKNLPRRWMRSMSEADEVIVLDTGSDDQTVSFLREAGAKVVTEEISPGALTQPATAPWILCRRMRISVSVPIWTEVFQPGWRSFWKTREGDAVRQATAIHGTLPPRGQEGIVFWIEKIHDPSRFSLGTSCP